MMFSNLYATLYSHHDLMVSTYIRFYFCAVFTFCILYICRVRNRRILTQFIFGYKQTDPDLSIRERTPYRMKILPASVVYMVVPYITFFTSCVYLLIFPNVVLTKTVIWSTVLWLLAGITITMGSHRLYAHKSYQASRAFQMVLMLLNCVVRQDSIIYWARDHRVHHKFVDTDADPYNAKRGLFFSHIGWLMTEKHPDIIKKGRTVDISDLTSNPVLAFQQRNFHILLPLLHFIIPWLVPYIFFGEKLYVAYFGCVEVPWVVVSTMTYIVNSWCHWYGGRPYNTKITPSDGGMIRNILSFGEGYHNYHHSFPYDYRCNSRISCTPSFLIQLFSRFGITWNLREASSERIERRKQTCALVQENYDF